MTDYYNKIDTWIKEHEDYKPVKQQTLSNIADYIDWAYRWKKITEKEKDIACDRMVALFERGEW